MQSHYSEEPLARTHIRRINECAQGIDNALERIYANALFDDSDLLESLELFADNLQRFSEYTDINPCPAELSQSLLSQTNAFILQFLDAYEETFVSAELVMKGIELLHIAGHKWKMISLSDFPDNFQTKPLQIDHVPRLLRVAADCSKPTLSREISFSSLVEKISPNISDDLREKYIREICHVDHNTILETNSDVVGYLIRDLVSTANEPFKLLTRLEDLPIHERLIHYYKLIQEENLSSSMNTIEVEQLVAQGIGFSTALSMLIECKNMLESEQSDEEKDRLYASSSYSGVLAAFEDYIGTQRNYCHFERGLDAQSEDVLNVIEASLVDQQIGGLPMLVMGRGDDQRSYLLLWHVSFYPNEALKSWCSSHKQFYIDDAPTSDVTLTWSFSTAPLGDWTSTVSIPKSINPRILDAGVFDISQFIMDSYDSKDPTQRIYCYNLEELICEKLGIEVFGNLDSRSVIVDLTKLLR